MTKSTDIVDVLLGYANGEYDMTPLAADLLRAANEIQMLRVACRKSNLSPTQVIDAKATSAAGKQTESLAQSILGSMRA